MNCVAYLDLLLQLSLFSLQPVVRETEPIAFALGLTPSTLPSHSFSLTANVHGILFPLLGNTAAFCRGLSCPTDAHKPARV